jgi:hypothetical protein
MTHHQQQVRCWLGIGGAIHLLSRSSTVVLFAVASCPARYHRRPVQQHTECQ